LKEYQGILDLETSRRSRAELKVKSAQLGLLHDLTKSMAATSELHNTCVLPLLARDEVLGILLLSRRVEIA
jgi:hypothetical protein